MNTKTEFIGRYKEFTIHKVVEPHWNNLKRSYTNVTRYTAKRHFTDTRFSKNVMKITVGLFGVAFATFLLDYMVVATAFFITIVLTMLAHTITMISHGNKDCELNDVSYDNIIAEIDRVVENEKGEYK